MKKLLSLLTFLFVSAISFAQETVTVSPTYSEAVHYTNLTGQKGWTVIAIILFIAVAAYLVLCGMNKLTYNPWVWIIGLIFSIAAWRSKPTACWLNNDKVVEKSYLEKVGRKYILDSCFNNNLMQNAAVK